MKFILFLILLGLGLFVVYGILMIIVAKFVFVVFAMVSMAAGWIALAVYENYVPNGDLGLLAFIGGVFSLWAVVGGMYWLRTRQRQKDEESIRRGEMARRLAAEEQEQCQEGERRRQEAAQQKRDEMEQLRLEVELAKLRQQELAKATPAIRWLREKTGW